MQNKKMFLSGIIVGIVSIIIINSAYNYFDYSTASASEKKLSIESKINTIYSILEDHYVDEYDKEELEETMFSGLLYGVGDPYTSYMDKKTLVKFMEQTEGTYAGIGVVVTEEISDNSILVVTPYEGAPGAKAGILPGDKFIKVNGTPVSGDNIDGAVSMMKGEPGTTVTITVLREKEDNKIFDTIVMREKVNIPTVSHKMLEDDIGYLRITNFERVTLNQFVEAYEDLTQKGMKGLIIDVRNNPGGLLDVVTDIADILVPKGYIVYTENKKGEKEYIYSDKNQIEIPLAILVNGNSASASEVLSGAVKDMNVGVLVGTQTFGKGLVQNLFTLPDKSAIKVTIAKYYTPSGVCINGEGLTPDYIVDMPDELSVKISSLTLEEDVQLKKALSVISDKIK